MASGSIVLHSSINKIRFTRSFIWSRMAASVQEAGEGADPKNVAPSTALRRGYGHELHRWTSFAAKYRADLPQRNNLLRLLDELRRRGQAGRRQGSYRVPGVLSLP